jgi:GNAT superfamily N-acetyltransferase
MYKHAMEEAKRGNRVLLVAEIEGEVIGQIFLFFRPSWSRHFPNEQAGYLHSFRVKPQFRNMGIGSALVGDAESILIERGLHRSVISPECSRACPFDAKTTLPGINADNRDGMVLEPLYARNRCFANALDRNRG